MPVYSICFRVIQLFFCVPLTFMDGDLLFISEDSEFMCCIKPVNKPCSMYATNQIPKPNTQRKRAPKGPLSSQAPVNRGL